MILEAEQDLNVCYVAPMAMYFLKMSKQVDVKLMWSYLICQCPK